MKKMELRNNHLLAGKQSPVAFLFTIDCTGCILILQPTKQRSRYNAFSLRPL